MSDALDLDRTSEPIEQLLMTFPVRGVEFKFLNPISGPQGTLEEADYYLATNYKVTREVMEQSPKLKLVTRTGVGFENVDIEYARSKGIPVTIAKGANAVSVAELVIAFMLDLSRKICLLDKTTKEGLWQSWDYRHESYDIMGKTLGVIGAGVIAREVITRVNAFGVHCVYYDIAKMPQEQEQQYQLTYMSMEELLAASDFVMVQLPLNDSTRDLIGKDQFRLMKKTAFIINTARGQIINEDALIWALDNHVIAGAALDVFNNNPPGAGHKLLTYPNVITTPHIGGATLDAYSRNFAMCTDNIRAVEQGRRPEFIVNGL